MSSSSTDPATLVDVTMPQMGVSVAEGTIVGWPVSVGEPIAADAPVCEISTDKIDVEVPSPVSGVMAEILVPIGETVPVGTVLARIAAGGGPVRTAVSDARARIATGDAPPPVAEMPAARPPVTNANVARNGRDRYYSPVVQRIAAEHRVDLSQVPGTGRGGRVRKPDVLAYVEAHGAGAVEEPPLHIESPYRPDPVPTAPGPAATGPAGTLSRMRRQIGEHMKRSLETAATCTTWIEVDMARIESARDLLQLTALPFVARATIAALREHPSLNATLQDDVYTLHDAVHLGIAVSLGDDGLIVPVVHDAHKLSVEGLAKRIRDLARRARARELTPDEVRGGTFTITNPGQYGSIMATPIINLPQVGILDLEAVVKRPVVVTDADGNDSIAIRPMTILGLSWDHRALDGVLAAQFLASIKRHLEGWTGA